MRKKLRFVLDTNVLVSAALTPSGKPRQLFEFAARQGLFLFSEETYAELVDVLYRPRLQRYLSENKVEGFLERVVSVTSRIVPLERIVACRDPKDDKFLEAAVSGKADYLVTGDQDLIVLHPFRGIPILTPGDFLETIENAG